MRQLSRADSHNALMSEILTIGFFSEHIENGENEDCCFACAWFGLAEHISILLGDDFRYGSVLYLAGELKFYMFNSNNELWSQRKIIPLHDLSLLIVLSCDCVGLNGFLSIFKLRFSLSCFHLLACLTLLQFSKVQLIVCVYRSRNH